MNTPRIKRLGSLVKSICNSASFPPKIAADGYSGNKVLELLSASANLLPKNGEESYVEIGVYRGLTLTNVAASLSAKGNSGVRSIGIDNFAQFDHNRQNESQVEALIANHGLANTTLWNCDYEVALRNWKAKFGTNLIGTLFVDGPHDYRSQLLCLLLAIPHLSQEAIIIIDDCNYPHVRLATRDFLIMHPEYKLVMEAYTPDHPMNVSKEERACFLEGWWNGVNVLARDPMGVYDTIFPETGDAREICEAEHQLQGRLYRKSWMNAVPLLDAALERNFFKMLIQGIHFSQSLKGRAKSKNMIQTLSRDLPAHKINPSAFS